MVNSHIINSLKSYIENPDPRYALMLKGKWGCGKTYLVNQWIEDTFKNPEKKDNDDQAFQTFHNLSSCLFYTLLPLIPLPDFVNTLKVPYLQSDGQRGFKFTLKIYY